MRKPEQVPLALRWKPEEIAARVAEVASALDREVREPHLILVGILKGASFLLADLARKLAAIVDKPGERRTEIACDFPLFTAETGVFAGYGMEYRGRYGQLPWIGEVPESSRETIESRR